MNDALGVRSIKRFRQLNTHVEHTIKRWRACVQFRVEALTLEQFHRDKRLVSIFFHRIDRTNVWVIQGRSGASFQKEAVQGRSIARKLGWKKLESDAAAKSEILSLIDNAHPTAAQAAHDAVMQYGLPDHEKNTGVAILGGGRTTSQTRERACALSRTREGYRQAASSASATVVKNWKKCSTRVTWRAWCTRSLTPTR